MNLQRIVGLSITGFSIVCLTMYTVGPILPLWFFISMFLTIIVYGLSAAFVGTIGKIAEVLGLLIQAFFCLFLNENKYFGMAMLVVAFLLSAAFGFYDKRRVFRLIITLTVSVAIIILSIGFSNMTFGWFAFNGLFSWLLWVLYIDIAKKKQSKTVSMAEKLVKRSIDSTRANEELARDAIKFVAELVKEKEQSGDQHGVE